MKKSLLLLAIGAVFGGLLAIPALRSSRRPDTPLGRLRAKLGMEPETNVDWERISLQKKYGPARQSQFLEEWIVRDFFHDQRGGTFVDVGAAHYKVFSNTWYLEENLGWSGIAVDAQDSFRSGWETYRKRSRFVTAFVSDQSNERARLFLSAGNPWVASGQQAFTDAFSKSTGTVDVPTITLNDLLDAAKMRTMDFLTMDIELAEPKALAGFDIERFKPRLVCVEAQRAVRQQILDYFAAHHYAVVGKYLRVDRVNLWYMPTGTAVEPFTDVPVTSVQ